MTRALSALTLLSLAFVFSACATKTVAPAPAGVFTTNSPPKCLSVQENDRHVEITSTRLFVAETGEPRALTLDDGDEVECEKLEIVRGAKEPAVFIRFSTSQAGTSVGVTDTKIGIASIKEAKWILAPVVVTRKFLREDGTETDSRAEYSWIKDAKEPTLVIVDTADKSKRTIRP